MTVSLRAADDLDFDVSTASGSSEVRSPVAPSSTELPASVAQVLRRIPLDDSRAATAHSRVLELSGAFTPPFDQGPFSGGRAEVTSAVLRAAAALLGQAQQLADPRITNTGLKLLGAGLHGAERVLKERHVLAAELRHGIVAMDANVGTLSQQRFDASLGAEGRRVRIRLSRPPRRLLIIAAANSRPARRLRRLLGKQLEIGWAIWAGPPPATRPELAHSQAFYPKPTTTYAPEEVALTGTKFTSFVCLADAVTKARYEVGLLIGMPVIPKALLACFPGPVVNVHNGQVPIYRGMDAVAWALWNDDPVYVCAHVVLPTVDSGPVLGEVLLDTNDPGALRALVSQATLELLLETATRLVHAPELETLEGRGATTRVGSLFRMHPLLRRHLRTRLERP